MITERVELQDDVSPAAKKAAASIRSIAVAIERLTKASAGVDAAGLEKISIAANAGALALAKAKGEQAQLTASTKAAASALVAQSKASADIARNTAKTNDAARLASLKAQNSVIGEMVKRDAALAREEAKLGTEIAKNLRMRERTGETGKRTGAILTEGERKKKGLLRRNTYEFSGGVGGGMGGFESAVNIAGGFILAKAAQVAAQIVARVAQAFVDGAKMAFEAATFRQGAEKGLAVILRSASKAKEVYNQGIKLAAELGTGAKETMQGLQGLIARGFPVDDAIAFTKAMADLQVVNPAANVESLLYNIAKIKGQGKVQGDELNALAEAGLNLGTIFELVAKQTGKTVPEVQKMLSAGKLTADLALPAILASVEALTGKPLGDTAKEASRSLGGLAKRLQNVGELTLLSADFGKASDRLSTFGTELMALIGPGTKVGGAVTKAIEDLATALTGLLGGTEGAAKTADAIEKMAAFGSGAAKGIEQIDAALGKLNGTSSGLDTATIEKIGTVVAWTAAIVVAAIYAIGYGIYAISAPLVEVALALGRWWDQIKAWFATITGQAGASGTAIGSALVTGLTAALTGGLSLVMGAAADLVSGGVAAARGPQGADAHSPSRKTIALGEDMAAGLPVGMSRQLASVRSASAGLISGLVTSAPPANQNGVGARGTGGGVPVIHVHLDGGAVAAAGGPAAAEAMGARAGTAAAEAYMRRMKEAS